MSGSMVREMFLGYTKTCVINDWTFAETSFISPHWPFQEPTFTISQVNNILFAITSTKAYSTVVCLHNGIHLRCQRSMLNVWLNCSLFDLEFVSCGLLKVQLVLIIMDYNYRYCDLSVVSIIISILSKLP